MAIRKSLDNSGSSSPFLILFNFKHLCYLFILRDKYIIHAAVNFQNKQRICQKPSHTPVKGGHKPVSAHDRNFLPPMLPTFTP